MRLRVTAAAIRHAFLSRGVTVSFVYFFFLSLSLTGKHAFANVTERVLEARCEKEKKKKRKRRSHGRNWFPPSGTDMPSAGPELNLAKHSETGGIRFVNDVSTMFSVWRCPTSTVKSHRCNLVGLSLSRQHCREGSLWMFSRSYSGQERQNLGGGAGSSNSARYMHLCFQPSWVGVGGVGVC